MKVVTAEQTTLVIKRGAEKSEGKEREKDDVASLKRREKCTMMEKKGKCMWKRRNQYGNSK